MTEEQPRPDLPEPEAQPPEPTAEREVHADQAQEKPLWKALTIRALRATIGVLESTVARLEAPPQPVPAPSRQEATPELDEWEEAETASPAPAPPEAPQEAQEPSKVAEPVETGVEAPAPAQVAPPPKRGWERVLERVRAFLPQGLNNLVPDWALTGVIVGSAVAIAWVSFFYLPDRLAEEIAEAPPPEAEVEEVEVPPEVEAPSESEPTPTKPTPPPPQLELTPEQSLIAAIQEQVTEITRQYAEGLIQSLTANFRQSRLVVTVSEQWYELTSARQNQLANEILERSRRLDFNKLAVVDPQGTLLARSPVVGEKMVILKREKVAALLEESNRSEYSGV